MTPRFHSTWIGLAIVALMAGGGWYFFQRVLDMDWDDVSAPKLVMPAMTSSIELPPVTNNAFAAGEKLHYNVIYKGVTVGHALIEVKNGPLVNGRPTWQYISTAKSTPFFDAFFKVRDKNISTVDQASLHSVAFDQNLREGRYRAIRQYTFDYKKGKFASSEKKSKTGETRNREGELEKPLHDVLSSLFYVRTQQIKPGRNLNLSFFHKGVHKPLPIGVDSEVKELKTALGKVSCLKVEPMIQGDSIFKSKDSKLTVWMTNDRKKIPVLMEAKIGVGLVRVKLDKWEK